MQHAKAVPPPTDKTAWLEERKRRDEACLMEVIEQGTVRGAPIRGTQRGRMLQQIEGIAELKAQLTESKAREVEGKEREALLNEQLAKKDAQIEKLMSKLLG